MKVHVTATSLAEWLRAELGARGMTQAELALGSGLSARSIGRWCGGDPIRPSSVERICDALGVQGEEREAVVALAASQAFGASSS